jgi:hypothetical protein
MNKAARAAQIGRCIAHTGDAFSFTPADGVAVSFAANVIDEPIPTDADGKRLGAQPPRLVRLTAARALFAARVPSAGEEFVGETGHRYRIAALPDAPSHATIVFLCSVSAPRP